jgi:two-component system nitrogen regulation sensor histidine kinase NtrY
MDFSLKRIITLRRLVFLFLSLSVIEFTLLFNTKSSIQDSTQRIEKKLHPLELEAKAGLEDLYNTFKNNETYIRNWEENKYENLFKEKGIVYLIYENDSLIFWTDNSPAIENYRKEICLDQPLVRLRNGWFEVLEHPQSNKNKKHFIALILIKNEFLYGNKYLTNDFQTHFNVSKYNQVSSDTTIGTVVKSHLGKKLFSLKEPYSESEFTETSTFGNLLFFILYILLIYIFYRIFFDGFFLIKRNTGIFLFVFSCLALRLTMFITGFPSAILQSKFFDSSIYGNADSFLYPQLGDLIMNFALLLIFSIVIFKHLDQSLRKNLSLLVLIITLSFYTILVNCTINTLVQNSNLNLSLNDFFNWNELSFVVITIVPIMFIPVFLIAVKLNENYYENPSPIKILFLILPLVIHSMFSIFYLKGDWITALWPLLFYTLIYIINNREKRFSFFYLLPLAASAAFASAWIFNGEQIKKDIDYRRVYAENLATQQDNVAENLFVDVFKKINTDQQLQNLIFDKAVNPADIEQRIRQVHLGGYWEKFNVVISVTDSSCNGLIKNENPIFDNNSYFDEQIESCGNATACKYFFFVDHPGSRQRYIARIPIYSSTLSKLKPSTIYLQMEAKARQESTGFPDLLLDESVKSNRELKNFSYAVYNDGNLLSKSGQYNYPETIFWKKQPNGLFTQFKKNEFDHISYDQKNISTTVSIPNETNISHLTAYSSSFAFYSFLLLLIIVIVSLLKKEKITPSALSGRIQFMLVAIILLSLISFGGGTFYVVKKQFDEKNRSNLEQLSKLFVADLQNSFADNDQLKNNQKEYSSYLLKKTARTFQGDVSVFDLNGNLFASSQPRLFDDGLISKKMNPFALQKLKTDDNNLTVLKEFIGNLEFYSSFQPLLNKHGKKIGYINLPYFSKQDDLEKEITIYISALTNIYVFLFVLSVLIALFFSRILTNPLRILQQRFSAMRLGGKNELIEWKENDEIGSLVLEYNKMVSELESSARKLAQSERESAWREMAKQVAHEIKNPLTPMKLNIQHLQRTIDDLETLELKQRVKKLSGMLIEQIDTLSSIASAFSNFAKMPGATLENVDLIPIASEAVQLFSKSTNVTVRLNKNNLETAVVLADREQCLRVFTNLIKNAIQAIPENRAGKVEVSIIKVSGKILIQIQDNGSGINEEISDKIFQPNFSTKSDGMGLGLAMTKSIIESYGGSISFVTHLKEGTTFSVELNEV